MTASDEGKACPIAGSINIFGGKWKPEILYFINLAPRRFNELRKLIPAVTQRMLTQQLRELERDGIIKRKQYNQIPPKVVYSMTDLGNTIIPIFKELEKWTNKNISKVEKARIKYTKKK
ncbi:MAG: helix-turn-helix domain-containing protein [Thermodesulfobacteriota bacterium]